MYSSHLSTWRHQRAQGQLQGLTPAKRGRHVDPQAAEIVRLQRETDRLVAQPEPALELTNLAERLTQLIAQAEQPLTTSTRVVQTLTRESAIR